MIETVLHTIHNITDFKVVYICPDHNEKYHARKLYMDELLKSKGFKDIVHFKSGTEAYPTCLAKATKEILTRYMDEPILLLEDDIELLETTDLTLPSNTDAIYLGLSSCASHPTENYNIYYAQFEPYSTTQVKVVNMLSAHAILYVSKRYKEAAIKTMDMCAEKGGFNDMALSRIQHAFNIYANKLPIFFQSNKFNTVTNGFDVEKATKLCIMDDLSLRRL